MSRFMSDQIAINKQFSDRLGEVSSMQNVYEGRMTLSGKDLAEMRMR
jgi:hypothetical protein